MARDRLVRKLIAVISISRASLTDQVACRVVRSVGYCSLFSDCAPIPAIFLHFLFRGCLSYSQSLLPYADIELTPSKTSGAVKPLLSTLCHPARPCNLPAPSPAPHCVSESAVKSPGPPQLTAIPGQVKLDNVDSLITPSIAGRTVQRPSKLPSKFPSSSPFDLHVAQTTCRLL